MKSKLILLFSLVWFGIQAQETTQVNTGHLNKGHFSFGISSNGLGFVSSSSKSSDNQGYYSNNSLKSTVFILGFDAGYLATDQLQVGLFADLNLVSSNSNTTIKHFGIGPKANYYFKSASDLVPFVSVSGGYFKEENYFFTRKGYDWNLGAGVSYFLNNYIAVQSVLQYQNKTYDENFLLFYESDANDPNYLSAKTGLNTSQLNFNIGFSIFF